MVFASGFSFGGGCSQDLDTCHPITEFVMTGLFIFDMPNLVVFSVMFYFGIQMPSMFLFDQQSDSSVNTPLMIIVLVPITFVIWTAFGAVLEWLIKDIENRLA